jgi:hypothetical protein
MSTTNLDAIKQTLIGITKGENVLDMLIELERTMDNAEIFAYRNWILGELVSGPDISRYWFTTVWMYPYAMMPDPDAGLRLTKLGAKVNYRKGKFVKPVRVRGPSDWADPISKRAKVHEAEVWLVTISMPMKYISIGLEQLDAAISDDLDKVAKEVSQAFESEAPDTPETPDMQQAEPEIDNMDDLDMQGVQQ